MKKIIPRIVLIAAMAISGDAIATAQQPAKSNSTIITGESQATRKRLAELEIRLLANQDILSDLLTLIDDAGDDLIASEKPDVLRPARHYAHAMIANLPATSRARYQTRVEASAKFLFDRAKATKQTQVIVDLLERYPNSKYAEEARFLLGEWQLEAGQPIAAERTWRALTEIVDSAELRNRISMAETAQTKFPMATSVVGSWSTLGGSANRDGRVTARLPVYWPSQPIWRTAIDTIDRIKRPAALSNSVASHPVILGKYAYFAEADRILSVALVTGEIKVAFQSNEREPANQRPKMQAVDFALTVAESAIYARLGPSKLWHQAAPDDFAVPPVSSLIRLVPDDSGQLKTSWVLSPSGDAIWQGAPCVVDGYIVAASVRKKGNRLIHTLAAYDRMAKIWERDIAESDVPNGDAKSRHELISIDNHVVVYANHAGAVVAVDLRNGKPLWAWKYPKLEPTGKTLALAWTANHRDINPPILHDGIAIIAPNDSNRIAAIDARTGQLIWEQVGYHVESLMGVSQKKVIATMAGPNRGVYAFDLKTGRSDLPAGWINADDPGLASLGRGLVNDELILWPTRSALYFLDPKSGRQLILPNLGPHGNLAFAQDVLISVNSNDVIGYVVPEAFRKSKTKPPLPLIDPNIAKGN